MKLAIADDHSLVILAIEKLAGQFPNIEVVSRSVNATQFDDCLSRNECDVVIMDYYMPGGRYGDGIELVQHVAGHYPNVRIVMLSRNDSGLIVK